MQSSIPDNPYLLLTPGPLSTTKTVKQAMLRDWCTWDDDYNSIVQDIRARLVSLATREAGYTAVLMQGSGTFSVESVLTSALPHHGKLLVLANGSYGQRMGKIVEKARIDVIVQDSGELCPPDLNLLEKTLSADPQITHVAVVHCETTTGMLNPIEAIGQLVKNAGKTYIVDAMSSFGGIPFDMAEIGADFVISSANKCIQGVPGFGFIVARIEAIKACAGQAMSLSLDLFDQWNTMEENQGKWRFTSPTHTVRAFKQALMELESEGGIETRNQRYLSNHSILVQGMKRAGFKCLLTERDQSPIITAFHSPVHPDYSFVRFYNELKSKGFVIYPGKVTDQDTFRIGNIGDISPVDMDRLVEAVAESMYWERCKGVI